MHENVQAQALHVTLTRSQKQTYRMDWRAATLPCRAPAPLCPRPFDSCAVAEQRAGARHGIACALATCDKVLRAFVQILIFNRFLFGETEEWVLIFLAIQENHTRILENLSIHYLPSLLCHPIIATKNIDWNQYIKLFKNITEILTLPGASCMVTIQVMFYQGSEERTILTRIWICIEYN